MKLFSSQKRKDSKYELFLSISKFKPQTFLKINTVYIEPPEFKNSEQNHKLISVCNYKLIGLDRE